MTGLPSSLEFSRPFSVDRLGPVGTSQAIEANQDERARLAARFGIVAIDHFAASVRLFRREGDLVGVEGQFEADVVQNCVVTLEPFPSHIADSFSADFTESAVEPEPEINLDLDYEPPESIEGGVIDIGELVAQFLSLALDPHPKAPDVALNQIWSGEGESGLSPFEVLEKLKQPR